MKSSIHVGILGALACLFLGCVGPRPSVDPDGGTSDAGFDGGAPDAGADAGATAPETSLTAGPSGVVTSRTAHFTFTSSQPGSTFECSLDMAPFAACASPRDYANLADGAHSFLVRALAGGLADETPARGDWSIDTSAPDTALTSGPADPVASRSARFTFSSPDAGATFECGLDGAAFARCASPVDASGLADGAHTFLVRAVNPLGTPDPTPASRTWVVDATPPQTAITSSPAQVSSRSTADFTFTATEPATFECSLDGQAFAACAGFASYSGLADGQHSFQVRATDALLNADATPATFAWTVDSAPPDTAISSGPSGLGASTTATFTFSATEPGSTFECSLDGVGFTLCASPLSFSNLADGAHTFQARAVDAALNVDATPATRAWTVDSTPPDTSLLSGPSGTVTSASASFTFSATESGATFGCALDGAAFAACTSPASFANLADGPHTFAVRARDAAGNTDPTPASRGWQVATTFPDTTLVSTPASLTNSASASFTFTASVPGATFECALDGAAFTACTSPAAYANLADGAHSFAVRARNTAGNADQTPATYGWRVDLVAPDTTLASGPSGATSATSASFSFTSEPGATFECSLDSATFSACASPKSYAGLAGGAHTFAVRAVDAALNVDPSPATASWTVDTTPPDTTLATSTSAITNVATASFTFTATEPGSTFECSLDAAPFAACTSPLGFTALADGSHTFKARALDAVGNVDASPASFTWTVDTQAPDTTITSGPSGSVSGSNPTFTFTSTEPGGTFECALDTVTFTACASPLSLSNLALGSHTFTVRAIDAANNTDATPASRTWNITSAGFTTLRLVGANISSGNKQSYDPGEGIRIFQGLKPDVAMIQEFNYGTNSAADVRSFVDAAFGPGFSYFQQPGVQIPNGVISRYPILSAGVWIDPQVSNRAFVWARIDVPGPKDLWAISVHLLTTSPSNRSLEATALVNFINTNVPASDYLVIGGDFNTDARTEACITTLSQVVVTAAASAPYPVDQNGNGNTNASRGKPYDWVLADPDLNPLRTTVVIGNSSYPTGVVFDSRVYTPLSEVSPVQQSDSAAVNMQHMAVVKDFQIPN